MSTVAASLPPAGGLPAQCSYQASSQRAELLMSARRQHPVPPEAEQSQVHQWMSMMGTPRTGQRRLMYTRGPLNSYTEATRKPYAYKGAFGYGALGGSLLRGNGAVVTRMLRGDMPWPSPAIKASARPDGPCRFLGGRLSRWNSYALGYILLPQMGLADLSAGGSRVGIPLLWATSCFPR